MVRTTRIVDPIRVDDAGADQAAEFQQMVSVTTIECDVRSVKAQHRADLVRTSRRHEALEARSGYGATGRASEIIVDHLDLEESVAARDSTRSYWRRLLSRFVSTCRSVD